MKVEPGKVRDFSQGDKIELLTMEVTAPARPYRATAVCAATLRGTLQRNLPTREYKYGWMTLEGTGKNLRPLDPQVDATIFNGGDGGLRNARDLGELALA